MNRGMLALLAASILAAPASAATLNEAIRGDLPLLMNVYRDMHANPELSMQEVRTPAKMAPGDAQARLRGDRACRQERPGRRHAQRAGTGADAARRHGCAAGEGADRAGLRVHGNRQAPRRKPRTPSCTLADMTRTWPPGSARRAGSPHEGPMVGNFGNEPAVR